MLLALPVLLLLAAEDAFRCGAYEPLAKPTSHAGQSIVLKRALADPRLARIDTVTLGADGLPRGRAGPAAASARARRGVAVVARAGCRREHGRRRGRAARPVRAPDRHAGRLPRAGRGAAGCRRARGGAVPGGARVGR